MSGPQIVLWPIEDEYSWLPDLGEAVASIGEPFQYKMCEERAPELPDVGQAVAQALRDVVSSWDGECEARIVADQEVALLLTTLQQAMIDAAGRNKLWYPVGEVLTWTPEAEVEL